MSEYYPPKLGSDNFHCMHCKVYAHQRWSTMFIEGNDMHEKYIEPADTIEYVNAYEEINIDGKLVKASLCAHCETPTLWVSEKIIFPLTGAAPAVNNDLDDSVKEIYNEAAAIATQSPRAAYALLRLALEILLKPFVKAKTINDAIKKLVEEGNLPPQIQQASDIIRITGNESVHPGQIHLNEPINVDELFSLINTIAEFLITLPKQTQEIYDKLPKKSKDAIKDRDSKT